MFAITGVTGKVGGIVAHALLDAKRPVRAVLRDPSKAKSWRERGCDIAIADMNDPAALLAAFQDAEGVFILPPPIFDPAPGFPEARATAAAVKSALELARAKKVVHLSSIGADATQKNILTQQTLMEEALGELPIPVTFLRPAWFMENCAWDVAPAKDPGVIPGFLQPLDKRFPMVATADIGATAAKLLQEIWTGRRIVELEGPRRISPNEIAAMFSKLLGHPVRMEIVPRDTWESLFRSQGMKNPMPRMRMLDGFNESWIEFLHGQSETEKGKVELETVLRQLIDSNQN